MDILCKNSQPDWENWTIICHISRNQEAGSSPTPALLSDEESIEILNQAKPSEWQMAMLGANIELYDFNLQETIEYFKRLEVRQNIANHHNQKGEQQTSKHDKLSDQKKPAKLPQQQDKGNSARNPSKCAICKKSNHVGLAMRIRGRNQEY